MAKKDVSKTWFETGDFPTQDQFSKVLEDVRWKDEPVVADDLSPALYNAILNGGGSQEITLTVDGFFTMLAKTKLVNIAGKNNGEDIMNLKFGTAPGGNQVGEIDVNPDGTFDLGLGQTFWANTTVYVSGVTGELILLIDRK